MPLSRVFNDQLRDIIDERSEPFSRVFNDQPRDMFVYILENGSHYGASELSP